MDYWNHTDFTLSAHPSRDIAIITGADDIITAVEESQVTLSNIRGSRFVTPIKVRTLLPSSFWLGSKLSAWEWGLVL